MLADEAGQPEPAGWLFPVLFTTPRIVVKLKVRVLPFASVTDVLAGLPFESRL